MKTILKYQAGSFLYGTNTDKSDKDFVGIFKEDLRNIILGIDKKHLVTTTNSEGKNGSEDVDTQMHELRSFVRMALQGQSMALESLFIPDSMIVSSSEEYEFIRANRDKLVVDLKPLVSYCKAQSEKFLNKGRRLQSLINTIEHFEQFPIHSKVGENPLYFDEYCYVYQQPDQNGKEESLYSVSRVSFHLNVTVKHLLEILRGKLKKYGERTVKSLDYQYDGKSYSHAIRLALQYLELVETKELTFPLKEADYLRKVKLCAVKLEDVQDRLDNLVEMVHNTNYDFGEPDVEFWENWLVEQYVR